MVSPALFAFLKTGGETFQELFQSHSPVFVGVQAIEGLVGFGGRDALAAQQPTHVLARQVIEVVLEVLVEDPDERRAVGAAIGVIQAGDRRCVVSDHGVAGKAKALLKAKVD